MAEAAPLRVVVHMQALPPGVLPYGLRRVSCISKTAGRIVAEVPLVGITVLVPRQRKHSSATTLLQTMVGFMNSFASLVRDWHTKPNLKSLSARAIVTCMVEPRGVKFISESSNRSEHRNVCDSSDEHSCEAEGTQHHWTCILSLAQPHGVCMLALPRRLLVISVVLQFVLKEKVISRVTAVPTMLRGTL